MAVDLAFTSRFIAKFEGFVDHVYLDAVGVETVGYGETKRDAIERYRSTGISEAEAFALLQRRVQEFADGVEAYVTNRDALTPERHAAFTSLAYNIGVGGFGDSTACRRFNQGDLAGACEAMGWWDKAGGTVLAGLARRRAEEMALFRGRGGAPAAPPRPGAGTGPGSLPIKEGDRSDLVRDAQQRLAGCGLTILVDGYYGPVSVVVVRTFQRDRGLDADGVIGPATWNVMSSAAAPPDPGTTAGGGPVWPGRLLGEGVEGDDVRQAQGRLSERGWSIRVDGQFGPKTAGTVRAFQAEKGLTVDALVGPRTWQAIWAAPVTPPGAA
jgi:GH24 family phage-related lysozyme (muramidase)/peptidoglycan hydrolase-like protein with peptidoglycan-binding domain